jgi:hypothetical protein
MVTREQGECTAALAVEEGAAPLVLLRMPGSNKLVAVRVFLSQPDWISRTLQEGALRNSKDPNRIGTRFELQGPSWNPTGR